MKAVSARKAGNVLIAVAFTVAVIVLAAAISLAVITALQGLGYLPADLPVPDPSQNYW